ncbi:iron-sulfur cluster assembly protein [Streptosporangium sp. NPDC006013]|uniref:metal-sulfur cluster assembly factor n=1 Tax=Streptosporangium sp. NPDC006013 TaxID=3155596 RepID=UPI0033A88B67
MSRAWSVGREPGAVVERRLAEVVDPCSSASVLSMSILQMGLVRDVTLEDGRLLVHLRLTSPSCMMVAYIAREVVERLTGLPGVTSVDVVPDEGLDWDPSLIDPAVRDERSRRLVLLGIGPRPA